MKTLADFNFDGKSILVSCIEKTEYKSLAQAVASLTVFTNPKTVVRMNAVNLFQIIRCKSMTERGRVRTQEDGTQVMLDDNLGPTHAFIWANGMKRKADSDLTFAHVWSLSQDVRYYTSLANICMVPSFLAKLTDTDHHIKELLRCRAYDLYHFAPGRISNLERLKEYDSIVWPDPLPEIENVEKVLRERLSRNKSSRTAKSAKALGWYFSDFKADTAL